MSRLSILDLEQRIDPFSEYHKLLSFLKNESFINCRSFIQYLEGKLNLIPYIKSSRTIEGYFIERGVVLPPQTTQEATDVLLYLISFYETYMRWVCVNNNFDLIYKDAHIWGDYEAHIQKMNNIVISILEGLNYKIIYEEENNQYGFKAPLIVKRDTDVDSVLPLVHSDIRIDLLSYLDFRVENNLQAKEDILARLYKTIIDDGKEIYFTAGKTDDFRLKYQNELYDRIKLVYNQTNIRHGGQGKIELTNEDKHKYYDMCFYLLLQLIRTPKSIEDMKEIKDTFAQKQKVNP